MEDGNKYITHLTGCKSKRTTRVSDEAVRKAQQRRKALLREASKSIAKLLARQRHQLMVTLGHQGDPIATSPSFPANGQTWNSEPQQQSSRPAVGRASDDSSFQPDANLDILAPTNVPHTIGDLTTPRRPGLAEYPIDIDQMFEALLQTNYGSHLSQRAMPGQPPDGSSTAEHADQQTLNVTYEQ